MDEQMNGWRDGGRGRGHSRRSRKKDEMKVELGADGPMEDERPRCRKHYLRLDFLSRRRHTADLPLHLLPPAFQR